MTMEVLSIFEASSSAPFRPLPFIMLSIMGRRSFAVQTDVSVLSDCHRAFDAVMKEFGRVDVLVNDAGVTALSDVTKIPERDIRWVYEVNVFAHWFMYCAGAGTAAVHARDPSGCGKPPGGLHQRRTGLMPAIIQSV